MSRLAGALPTTNELLTALVKLVLVAVSCLVPVTSIRRLVKVATPLPAFVPMSKEVVPCNGPVPLLNVRVTKRLEESPTPELLPNWSCDLTTGWIPNTEPATAAPGWVLKVRKVALAGLTTTFDETAAARLPLLKPIVIVLAIWCDRLVKLTTPLTAVAVSVVLVELAVIAWVRHRFMDTPLASAVFQVVLGGVLVFLAGVLIGSS